MENMEKIKGRARVVIFLFFAPYPSASKAKACALSAIEMVVECRLNMGMLPKVYPKRERI